MKFRKTYMQAALVGALFVPVVADAQTPPTNQADAQKLLQTRPDVVAALVSKLRASGMTVEQTRARLKSQGYPENLLDVYLVGGDPKAGTPPADVAARALQSLGLSESVANAPTTAPEIAAQTTVPAAQQGLTTGAALTEGGLPVFGVDIFRRTTNQFDPVLAGPVDENYRVGPRDVLQLIITGGVEAIQTLEVSREGTILIDRVGLVSVANLTLAQIRDVLYQKLGRVYSGIQRGAGATTFFTVTVSKLRANQVFVLGDVTVPGAYTISSVGTALTALYTAGGPTVSGSLRSIEIRRAGRVVGVLDLYDYLMRGDASKDVRLENSDIVFVRSSPKHIAITGEVGRPAVYELKPGETLADLVAFAGGFKATAANRRIEVSRIVPPAERPNGGRDRIVFDVQGPELLNGTTPRTPLLNGDHVTIFAINSPVRDVVAIAGDVWAPGSLGFTPGMRLSEAIRKAGGVKGDAYLGEILITRQLPDQRTEIVRSRLSDTLGTVTPDVVLRDGDQIRIFSVEEFRTSRTISLSGAVRRPVAPMAYQNGITFRDLMQLAGGVEEGPDVFDSVTVVRLQPDLTNRTFQIPLREASGLFNAFAVQPGDAFTVRARSEFRVARTVTVAGAVKAAATVPFVEGLTLRQAIIAAGGLTESAYLPEVEISRRPVSRENGTLATVFRVPLDSTYILERGPDGKYLGPPGVAASAVGAPEVLLQPYDHVNVLTQPDWFVSGSVTIGGEVRFPGTYTVKNRTERISDLIARAGGLTNRAFTDGAVFRREATALDAADRARLLTGVQLDRNYSLALERIKASARISQSAAAAAPGTIGAVAQAVNTEESALQAALNFGEGQSRIAIDLSEVLRNPNTIDNFQLRAGDMLTIPVMNPTVTVRGFVNAPVTLPYRAGSSIDDYIAGAGGLTQNADPQGAFVQQPNGKVVTYRVHKFRPDEVPVPGPGATIIVPPREVKIDGGLPWGTIFQGLGTFATSLAAIISLSR